jgi:hypothetical protein
MEDILESNSRTARIASAMFFFLCVPMSIWESNVQAKIFAHDPASTANNLLSNEFVFRSTIVSHIVGTSAFIIMMLLLYRLFRPVDSHLARLMIIPILAQFPIVFIMEVVNFTALMTLKIEARPTFDVLKQQEVAYFLLRLHRYTFGADKIVFGLGFIPFGMLVLRSGFAPRIIGIFILIGGLGYVIDTCLYFLLARAAYLNVQSMKLISSVCYALGFLWFLIKGVRKPNILTT